MIVDGCSEIAFWANDFEPNRTSKVLMMLNVSSLIGSGSNFGTVNGKLFNIITSILLVQMIEASGRKPS